jgi:hypothetical protein
VLAGVRDGTAEIPWNSIELLVARLCSCVVADQYGEVVVLGFGPEFEGGDDLIGGFVGAEGRAFLKEGGEAIGSELFAGCVCGFEDAVGVEDETIAGLKRVLDGGVGGEGKGCEHETVFG